MPASITENDASYSLDMVRAFCAQVGPGLPGSPQEQARAEYFKLETLYNQLKYFKHFSEIHPRGKEGTVCRHPLQPSWESSSAFLF